MSTSLDIYPSTNDYTHEADPVLALIENARARYLKGGTQGCFIDERQGYWCAVGSLWAADGVRQNDLHASGKASIRVAAESCMSEAAKEAMALLDAVTLELYPETKNWGGFFGPLEYLNQRGLPFSDIGPQPTQEFLDRNKPKVLRVYDLTIERRKARNAEFSGDNGSVEPIAVQEPELAAV